MFLQVAILFKYMMKYLNFYSPKHKFSGEIDCLIF